MCRFNWNDWIPFNLFAYKLMRKGQRIARLHPSFVRDDTIPPYDIEKAKLNFKNRSAHLTSRSSPQITITNGKVDKYEVIIR